MKRNKSFLLLTLFFLLHIRSLSAIDFPWNWVLPSKIFSVVAPYTFCISFWSIVKLTADKLFVTVGTYEKDMNAQVQAVQKRQENSIRIAKMRADYLRKQVKENSKQITRIQKALYGKLQELEAENRKKTRLIYTAHLIKSISSKMKLRQLTNEITKLLESYKTFARNNALSLEELTKRVQQKLLEEKEKEINFEIAIKKNLKEKSDETQHARKLYSKKQDGIKESIGILNAQASDLAKEVKATQIHQEKEKKTLQRLHNEFAENVERLELLLGRIQQSMKPQSAVSFKIKRANANPNNRFVPKFDFDEITTQKEKSLLKIN